MKLLLFTRALVSAPSVRFDAANRPQPAARTLRSERTARLRCVWSRGADGRLACRWLRDDVPAGDGAIPVEAIRRFPAPVSTRNDRPAPDRLPRAPKGIEHVRHVRPA